MIILNSLKSITVITATVVLSYFIWNKIVAWEKTAKCGAADFPHFTEMCLKWKLCPAEPESLVTVTLLMGAPWWSKLSTGTRLSSVPESQRSRTEQRRQPESLFHLTLNSTEQEQLCTITSPIPFHALLPEPSANRTNSAITDPQNRKSHCRETSPSYRGFQKFTWLKTKPV